MNFQQFNQPRLIGDVFVDLEKLLEANRPENIVADLITDLEKLLLANKPENILTVLFADLEKLVAANSPKIIVAGLITDLEKMLSEANRLRRNGSEKAMKLPPGGLASLKVTGVLASFDALLAATRIEQNSTTEQSKSFASQSTALL